jgi:predicted transcriptional regulator
MNKKVNLIGFKVDDAEQKLIEQMAQQESRTISNMIRLAIKEASERRGIRIEPVGTSPVVRD